MLRYPEAWLLQAAGESTRLSVCPLEVRPQCIIIPQLSDNSNLTPDGSAGGFHEVVVETRRYGLPGIIRQSLPNSGAIGRYKTFDPETGYREYFHGSRIRK